MTRFDTEAQTKTDLKARVAAVKDLLNVEKTYVERLERDCDVKAEKR